MGIIQVEIIFFGMDLKKRLFQPFSQTAKNFKLSLINGIGMLGITKTLAKLKAKRLLSAFQNHYMRKLL